MSATLTTRALGLGIVLAAGATLAAAPSANAAAAGTFAGHINGGVADFGSGLHALGAPTGDGTLDWDLSPTAGNADLNVSARVRGTLYWDSLDAGRARVIVTFEDRFQHVLATRTVDAPGPGGNANLASNQAHVDVSFTSPDLDKVVIQTRQVLPNGGLTGGGSLFGFAPLTARFAPRVNNGNADFGSGSHVGGAPVGSGSLEFNRLPHTMTADVRGTAYWDALFSAGCTRVLADFEDASGHILATLHDQDACGPGGDANDVRNQHSVTLHFESPALFKVRLRVGAFVNGTLVGAVATTYTFADG
jgi:hypothetical protein